MKNHPASGLTGKKLRKLRKNVTVTLINGLPIDKNPVSYDDATFLHFCELSTINIYIGNMETQLRLMVGGINGTAKITSDIEQSS